MPAEYTLVGNFESLTGSTTGWVQIELAGYGAQSPRVAGVGVISQKFYASAVGTSFSVTLWGNDQITPASTYYKISTFRGDGTPVFQNEPFLLTGSGTNDLSTLTPLSAAPPPIPVPSTVSANLALMGPVSGGAAPPVYRTIQNADLQFITTVDNVTIYADRMSGADNSAKIAAAIALLPSTGGIVDARSLPNETSGGSVDIDPGSTQVTLLLPPVTTFIHKLTLQNGLRIIGSGQGASILKASSTTQTPIVCGTSVTIQNLELINFQVQAQTGSAWNQHGIWLSITNPSQGVWYSYFRSVTVNGFGGNNWFVDGSGGGIGNTTLGTHQFNTFENCKGFRPNVSAWVSGTSYVVGNLVTINSGQITTYSGSTAYTPGKIVLSGGNLYMCIANTTGNAPPNATYWTAITQYQTATTYRCIQNTSNANPLNAGFWAPFDNNSLQISGAAGQLTFINCETDGNFGGPNSGVNVKIIATSSVPNDDCVPYSLKFIKQTNQFSALGWYINGAITVHLDSPHHESVYGGILIDYDSVTVKQSTTGIKCNDGHWLTNSGVNGGAGYLASLTSSVTTPDVNGNEFGDLTFTANNVFGFAGVPAAQIPDNVIYAPGRSTQVVVKDNSSASSSSTIGTYTFIPSLAASNAPAIGRSKVVNLTTSGTAVTIFNSLLAPGELLTVNCTSGPVTFNAGSGLNLGLGTSSMVLNTGDSAVFASLEGSIFALVGMNRCTPTIVGKTGSGAGNYTTTNTSYAVVDGTNLNYTVTIPTGWKLLIRASGNVQTNTGSAVASVAIVDTAVTGLLAESVTINVAGAPSTFALDSVYTGDGASHTIQLQFRTSNASDAASIVNSSATASPKMTFLLTPSN